MDIKEIIKDLEKVENQLPYKTFVNDGNKQRIDGCFYFNKTTEKGYLGVVFGDLCQGPPEFVHGGAIASLMDESMGALAWMNDYKVMTAKLEVRYLRPIPLNIKLYGELSIEHIHGKTVIIKGRLISGDEKITFAKSQGLFSMVDLTIFNSKSKVMDTVNNLPNK